MPNFYYVQQNFKTDKWRGVPANSLAAVLEADKPEMVSVLAVSRLVDELTPEEISSVTYAGPLYFDFDSEDVAVTIRQVNQFLDKLESKQVDLESIHIYASGKRGFHIEIPQEIFMEKVPAKGVPALPVVYREVALDLYVDTLDLNVYSAKRGRMWRAPNIQRENGKYKVPVTAGEVRDMDAEAYATLTSAPRRLFRLPKGALAVDLSVAFSAALHKVEDKLKARAKVKPDPKAKEKASGISIEMLMAGEGLRDGPSFNAIALQVAIAAVAAGRSCSEMLDLCSGLIKLDSWKVGRYGSEQAKYDELSRMYAYVNDNPCYTFSVGGIKSLLSHAAPDLDGIPVERKDIQESIDAKEGLTEEGAPDEYNDVSGGVTLNKYGVYTQGEFGPKRVSAVSFRNVQVLYGLDESELSAYRAEVLVNGKSVGFRTLERDTFYTVQAYNKFLAKLGHAFQGTENQIRGTMMRFVEMGKKVQQRTYIVKREGLDVVHIPGHEIPCYREDFLTWADGKGAVIDPKFAVEDPTAAVGLSFVGFPEPRGVFRSDLFDAPALKDWLLEEGNAEALKATLYNLFTCQRSEVLAKLLGWFTAASYRMIFHKAYNQFPLLHVHGSAGSGKSSMVGSIAQMYYYVQEAKVLSPASTVFAIVTSMSASASIPLVIDEYKPHEMGPGVHNRFTSTFRTAYNCGDLAKGGGTRDSDDYRTLHQTQISAPIVFIGEAAEEQAAVAERIVLVTVVKPPDVLSNQWSNKYALWSRNPKHLGLLGKVISAQALASGGVAALRAEFDPLLAAAKKKYMLSEEDLDAGLSEDVMTTKRNSKDRSVFNYTVSLFGLKKFRQVVEAAVGATLFRSEFEAMEAAAYTRMNDLQSSTQPEWAKVLDTMSAMSHSVSPDSSHALVEGHDYAFTVCKGVQCVEIAMLSAYLKYRAFMRQAASTPLFQGHQPFLHSIKDAPGLVSVGTSMELSKPGVYTFSIEDLSRVGVNVFKS
jgi:hypothetical protein